ncbi:MAG: methylenetetrahydrofolate reductase [Bacteroidaceae bacterium]|nr:methylenetetrahydrofolate reductase [Bacteroidaceae bacterium]
MAQDTAMTCPRPTFSFEILPPLKGAGLDRLRRVVDTLREFEPSYINITTHSSEYVYTERADGLLQRTVLRRRPGTVAVAAALQYEYGIPVVPHILCQGFTREETEYVLLDLQFLGMTHVLALRGDKPKVAHLTKPDQTGDTNAHATDLIRQINDFNQGRFIDGSEVEPPAKPFTFGVACYPEKHEEAPNAASDLAYFKEKVRLGAAYGVTQLFYDNAAYFRFVEKVRAEGISVPIIPGLKPFTKLSQLTTIPKTFHCDLPEALVAEARLCKTDEDARRLGIAWGRHQAQELVKAGVPGIHFYSMGAADSIREIAREVY